MEYGRITKMFRFWVVLSQQQRPQQRQQQQMNSGAICTFTRQWFGSRAGRSQINGFQASRSPTYVSQVEPTAAAGTTPKYADICWRICWVAELPGDWVEWIWMWISGLVLYLALAKRALYYLHNLFISHYSLRVNHATYRNTMSHNRLYRWTYPGQGRHPLIVTWALDVKYIVSRWHSQLLNIFHFACILDICFTKGRMTVR